MGKEIFKNLQFDNRLCLALVMLVLFFGWLSLAAFWFLPLVAKGPVDPMMALIAGLGIGGVTNSLIVLITLTWQYYFRKKETTTPVKE